MVDWENLPVRELTKQLHNFRGDNFIALLEAYINLRNLRQYDVDLAWTQEKIIATLKDEINSLKTQLNGNKKDE